MAKRLYARELLAPARVDRQAELRAVGERFRAFLPHWHFINRETGRDTTFVDLWPGQQELVEQFERARWVFALKAGKLGFTELACAFDAWVALCGPPNARIHLYSMDADAARSLLGYIRYGLQRLPQWLGLPLETDTMDAVRIRRGDGDVRTIQSYAATRNAGIDQSIAHAHVDELARMPHPAETWSSVQSIIVPGGSCHILTRGYGPDNYSATLWEQAGELGSELARFFAPYDARPDRDARWRDDQGRTMPRQGLLQFAPETPEDALAGDEAAEFISAQTWAACLDPDVPGLQPGDRTPIVIGVDAGVKRDYTAIVAVSRHPQRPEDVAIRAVKVWKPEPGRPVQLADVERVLRALCEGCCVQLHPRSMPLLGCRHCEAGEFAISKHNVVQITYDETQLIDMAQRLERDRVAWMYPFPQGHAREIADSRMLSLALQGRLSHNGDDELREHVINARAQLSKDGTTNLRIVKGAPNKRIDAAVAASMAIDRSLYLNLGRTSA